MSREGGAAGACRRDGGNSSSVAAQSFPPQFYPVAGYQGNSHTWFVPHPSSGVPGQWSPSWHPPMGYPTPTPPWSGQQTPSTTSATTTVTPASDEYTVDTLRRIYKDDDGRVEIQRVKVQRRQPENGAVSLTGPGAMSVVPVGAISRNDRRPPPRKHRRKQDIPMAAMGPMGPYPWYPYMSYMPYPYPYPYYFGGCMWPSGAPTGSISTWSGNEDSEAVSSHQDSALNSQRLESRVSHLSGDSLPSALHRASSPAAASHITESHSIAPSDSVSVRGRKRETSLERALLGPTPPPRTKSRASSSLDCKSDHVGKTQEWMLEMQRALRTGSDVAVKADDNSALKSDQNEVYRKIPPVRKRRKIKAADMSDQSSMTGLKEVDDVSEQQSVISEATFDDSSRLSSELNYAFRKLERSVDAFRTEIAADSSPVHSFAPSPSVDISHSSGAATPTEANITPLPLSDICGLARRAKEEEMMKREKYERPRATSESVCSLPSLETARVGSAPDVSLRSKTTVISSSQLTTPTETRTTTLTPTNTCPSPGPQTSTASTAHVITSSTETGSVKPQELTSKTEGSKEVPVKLSTSIETAQTSDTDASPLSKSPPPPACQPSSPPHSHQAEETKEQSHKTTEETETGIPKEAAEIDSPPALETIGPPSFKSTNVSATGTPAATGFEGVGGASGRISQASSATTFFSVRTADDSHALDTDSTDIPMPTTDSADENEESPGSAGPEEDQQLWVLQRPEEAPTLNTTGQDEHRNAWRAEVSLWRASLVVSLCRGRGLDRQDWTTFHLMVHHPLTMDLKLSLLHAPRLCAANSSVGPAVLRVALIQLAQYGEVLLQPEASRQPGWRCIRLDGGQAWAPLKGAAEILHSLGYQERRSGMELRYRQRCSPEASVVARLTLDMLVLAEEFRLFLTGTHQYPTNVSSLFFPESLNTGVISDLPQRPLSSEGSFVSAQSEAVIAARPQSEASSVTDDDTETLQTCTIQTAQSKLTRNKSTSEEDVTLREEDNKIVAVEKDTASAEKEERKTETTAPPSTETNTKTSLETQEPPATVDPVPIIPDETTAPDTQAAQSTTRTSEASTVNETVTPTTTPAEPSAVDSSCKADKASPVSASTTTSDTTNDNPEEHVYEEIDVIRAQVQSLRASSVPTESVPPPLPPKKKINAGGEDESQLSLTYPHVDRSSASTPASLRGGSTGARRKKRRAPMPPEFLPPNWRENQETPKQQDLEVKDKKQESTESSTTKKVEYRRSLNPFYEELDCVEDGVKETDNNKDADQEDVLDNSEDKGNPFLEKKVKVKGYIGKNPFYEDVEILKKSDEYKELKENQPSPAAPESTSAPGSTSEHHEPPIRKRRAPHPPPTTQTQDASTASRPEDSAHDDNLVAASPPQAAERSDDADQACKQTSQSSPDKSNIESSLLASSNSTKTNSETKTDPEPETKAALNKDENPVTAENKSPAPPLPEDGPLDLPLEAAVPTTPKQSRATRAPLPHPKVPPPPLPPLPKIPTSSSSKEESPPPIPPPKAPLSLLDEIPYMDANEIKEAREQTQSSDSHLHDIAGGGSPAAMVKFSHTLPRQSSLARVNETDLPPLGLPPPPPCPPPESPPETPHTSPPESPHASLPETPHVSPPETPHTSPPETPHASPPVTPCPFPENTPLPPSRHKPQNSSVTTEKGQQHEKADAVTKAEDEAPPVPPKPFQLEIANGEAPCLPPRSPIIPPKAIQQGDTQHPPRSPKASHTSHTPVTGTVSSTSEERYEIPDTSRAPPPRPPIPIPSKMQQQQQQQQQEQQQQQQQQQQEQANGKASIQPTEEERYEVPEVPKHPITVVSKGSVEVVKAPEAEERYEIPEVVKDQPVKRGVNGAVCTAGLGHTSSARKGEIAAIFGPPKPPRRRRNNHSPPPRPPKSCSLDGTKPDGLNEASLGSTSTTSSYTSSSSEHPPPSLHHKSNTKHRSWPFLLCNCLYVNCRTYEDADK